MAVFRVDLYLAEPALAQQGIDANVPKADVVRTHVFHRKNYGVLFAAVFKREELAEAYHLRWKDQSAQDWSSLAAKLNAANAARKSRPEQDSET